MNVPKFRIIIQESVTNFINRLSDVGMEQQDYKYIDQVLKGDHRAYAYLVDKYKYMVYTIAVKMVENEAEAEDIAQEVFIKAYRQLYRFERRSKFSTWLYTIAYRTAASKLKENALDMTPLTDELSDTYWSEETSTEAPPMEASEQQRFVRDAIGQLPKLEAVVVTLYYLDERSVKEIQEITGLTAENIKIRLFRARKKLEHSLRFLLE